MKRRIFIKCSAFFGAFAALRGVDYVLGESRTLPSIAFSDKLVELLLFLKTKTRLVCLGDTDHRQPELFAFLSSRPHLERLGQGFDHVFLETSERVGAVMQSLQEGRVKPEEVYEWMPDNSWLSGAENKKIAQTRARALWQLKKPVFHGIDARLSSEKIFSPPSAAVLKLGHVMHKVTLPLSTSGVVWLLPGLIVEGALGKSSNFFTLVIDDAKPAEKILSVMQTPKGSGLVVYGAGHFDGSAERNGLDSLFKLTQKAGFAPILANLFFSEQAKEEHYQEGLKKLERSFRPASVDFILQGEERPPCIAFNDEKMGREFAERTSRRKRPTLSSFSRRDFLRFRV